MVLTPGGGRALRKDLPTDWGCYKGDASPCDSVSLPQGQTEERRRLKPDRVVKSSGLEVFKQLLLLFLPPPPSSPPPPPPCFFLKQNPFFNKTSV